MIDPDRITNFSRTDDELEEFILFCAAVAGHNAHTTAKALESFLSKQAAYQTPFQYIISCLAEGVMLDVLLASHRFGCYRKLAKAFAELSLSGLNLRTCTPEELETIHGIGPKTSRFFILHSRPDQNNIAVLDRHILKYLGDLGVSVPKSTPNKKKYKELERIFVNHAREKGVDIATLDLEIWRQNRTLPSDSNGEVND